MPEPTADLWRAWGRGAPEKAFRFFQPQKRKRECSRSLPVNLDLREPGSYDVDLTIREPED